MRVALFAFLLTAAAPALAQGFVSSQRAPHAQLSEIVVARLPVERSDGHRWDALSAPDPWIFLYNSHGAVIAQFGPYQDLTASRFPLRLPVPFTFAPGESFRLTIYDQDVSDHDVIVTYDITLPSPGLPGIPLRMPLEGPDHQPLGEVRYGWVN